MLCRWAIVALHVSVLLLIGLGEVRSSADARPAPLRIQQLENVFQYATNLFGGSAPEAEADFRALARLGIRTVVSVDGAKPLVEMALTHGIRYVHVPFGYANIPELSVLQLLKVLRESEGALYVHCHHGKHRGPAAIMSMLVADGRLSPQTAVSILEQVGTSPAYAGLYRDVTRMRPVSAADLARTPDPPSTAELPDFLEAMAKIDRVWERLKRIQANGWRMDANDPDIDPSHEALMLRELLVESGRDDHLSKHLNLAGDKLAEFTGLLDIAAREAGQLETLLRTNAANSTLNHTLENLNRSCTSCHRQYRDD